MTGKVIIVGFISKSNPEDKRASSGTFHTMACALQNAGFTVRWIPIRDNNFLHRIYLRVRQLVYKCLPFLKIGLPAFPSWEAKIYAKSVNHELLDSCDVLFAPMQSLVISKLKTSIPIVYLSDATYHLMWDYYWFNLPKRVARAYEKLEKTALDKAKAIVYPSHWAISSAVSDYNQSPQKIHLAYFGPNLQNDRITPHPFSYKGSLDLLFVGVDWERKGGQVAVDACKWLNQNGVLARLHIVGIKSLNQDIATLPFIRDEGFLDKNDPGDYAKLVDLYSKSDCFILPTRAECAGICFIEAAAFGLPCFSYRTGGVEDYIADKITGKILAPEATGRDFGIAIQEALETRAMDAFSQEALALVQERLNWDNWSQAVSKIVNAVYLIQENESTPSLM